MKMSVWFSVFVLGCVCVCAAFGQTNEVRSIAVTGRAIGYVPADTVVWELSLVATDRDLVTTKEKSEEQVRSLTSLFKQRGVQAAEMDTGLIKTENAEGGGGIKMTRVLTVREIGLANFAQMLGVLGTVGNIGVHYSFESSQRARVLQATCCKAVEAAKSKAAAMATAGGTKLGRVLEMNEYLPPGWETPIENVIVDVPSRPLSTNTEKVDILVYAKFELD